MRDIWEEQLKWVESGEPFVLARVIHTWRSAPHLAAQRHVSLPSPLHTGSGSPLGCPAEAALCGPAGSGGRTGVGDGAELLRRALRILRVLIRVPPQRQPPVRLLHLPHDRSRRPSSPGQQAQRRRDGVGCLSAAGSDLEGGGVGGDAEGPIVGVVQHGLAQQRAQRRPQQRPHRHRGHHPRGETASQSSELHAVLYS